MHNHRPSLRPSSLLEMASTIIGSASTSPAKSTPPQSSSSFSPSPPSSDDSEKSAFVLLKDCEDDTMSEWYAFDISDDPNHNPNQTLPPPPYLKYANHLSPSIHEEENNDDDPSSSSFNLKPLATSRGLDHYVTCWAILGSSLYRVSDFVGNKSYEELSWFYSHGLGNSVLRTDLLHPNPNATWESLDPTPNQLSSAHALVLKGKLYCLGGLLRRNREVGKAPWAMAYDPDLGGWESLPDPPLRPRRSVDFLFSAAVSLLPSKQCIVVGSPLEGILQIYNADTKLWEEKPQVFEHKELPFFTKKDLTGYPLAVDNKLYWYVVKGDYLGGYDLVTKSWFLGRLPLHDHRAYFDELGGPMPPRLGHLGGGDKFCLFWVSVFRRKTSYASRIHCLKFQVTATTDGNFCPSNQGGGLIPLEVSILSCQSYLVPGRKYFNGALVLDGHLE